MKKGIIIICCLSMALFYSCKKYPENRLWFKNPEKAFKAGYLKYLKVDGVDSLDHFSQLYGFDLRKDYFYYTFENDNLTSTYMYGALTIKKKSPSADLYLQLNNTVTNYNYAPLFPLHNNATWQILKLTARDELKMQLQRNGKTYEVLFN